MAQNLTFSNSKGDKLAAILDNPTGDTNHPVIVYAHGHSSNKNKDSALRLSHVITDLGLSFFRFDFYGHGESEGDFANAIPSEVMDDILQAIKFLKGLGYAQIGLLGSSYGGLAAILAAAETPGLFALVLKSPVSNYADIFNSPRFKVDLAGWKQRGWLPYDEDPEHLKLNYIFYTDAVKRDGYAAALKIKAPTLIVHGDQDQDVPLKQSLKLAKLIPNCRLVIIKGADHRYTQPPHAHAMLSAISQFLLDHC